MKRNLAVAKILNGLDRCRPHRACNKRYSDWIKKSWKRYRKQQYK